MQARSLAPLDCVGVCYAANLRAVCSPLLVTPPGGTLNPCLQVPAEQAAEGSSGLQLPMDAVVPEQVNIACCLLSSTLASYSFLWPKQRVRRWPACGLIPDTSWHAFYRRAPLQLVVTVLFKQ